MGLVWRCLFALFFLFRGGKGSCVLVVSSWSLRFRVNGWIVICLLCIEAQVLMTECLIVFVKLWGASSQLILSLVFVLWVISTVTTQSGWDHASLMPMVWLLLILPLLLTVLNWLMVPLIELEVWQMSHLQLVLTNVPDLCNVHVHGNVGRSDHASLGVALNSSPAVAGFDVARRVLLKSRVNWNAVCEALSGLNWRNIFRSPTMVHDFDREVSGIMERFVPMVTVRRRGVDAAWFNGDCRRAFELKQSAYHRWCRNRSVENWDLFCQARGTASRLYAAAKTRYSADCRRNLDDCSSANAWWRTLKGHVFGAESDISPLCSPGGALVSDPAGKAELLSNGFDSKQSRDIVELPQTCHPRPTFCGIAFRACEVEHHLLDLDPNSGLDPTGCFPMFFRNTASVLAPKLSCLFCRLLRGGEFPLEWRIADVTQIPKGPLSALVCNYRPISITPVLSKVFERLIVLRFGRFLERSGVLPSHQYSYRKRLGTCDSLLDIVCAGQLELDRGGELALVQIDFSVAFDRVNHGGLVFKLREAGVGGLILKVFQNFLSSRTQRVKVDGVFSSSIDVVSGVPQGCVLGPLLFLLYIAFLSKAASEWAGWLCGRLYLAL